MLNKIFIILALVCGLSFADELENCVYIVSQRDITFYCDYNGGNSNYEMSFDKSDIRYCVETINIDGSITTIDFRRSLYDKTVIDELGATIEKSTIYIDVEDDCRESYDHLKSISTRNNWVKYAKHTTKFRKYSLCVIDNIGFGIVVALYAFVLYNPEFTLAMILPLSIIEYFLKK